MKKNLPGGRPASFSLILPHKYFLGNFLSGKFYDFLKFCGSHKTHTPLSGRITQRRRKMFNHDILWIQSNKKSNIIVGNQKETKIKIFSKGKLFLKNVLNKKFPEELKLVKHFFSLSTPSRKDWCIKSNQSFVPSYIQLDNSLFVQFDLVNI